MRVKALRPFTFGWRGFFLFWLLPPVQLSCPFRFCLSVDSWMKPWVILCNFSSLAFNVLIYKDFAHICHRSLSRAQKFRVHLFEPSGGRSTVTSKSLERTLSLRCLCFAFLYFVCVRPSFHLFVHSVRKAVVFFFLFLSLIWLVM